MFSVDTDARSRECAFERESREISGITGWDFSIALAICADIELMQGNRQNLKKRKEKKIHDPRHSCARRDEPRPY